MEKIVSTPIASYNSQNEETNTEITYGQRGSTIHASWGQHTREQSSFHSGGPQTNVPG